MEEKHTGNTCPANPRRKIRSKTQIFKESYLPAIIAGIAMLLIVVFIIGSITRSVQKNNKDRQARQAASVAASIAQEKLDNEVATLLSNASAYAAGYDYENAIAIIDSFSGDPTEYPELDQHRAQYESKLNELVPWEDLSSIVNLSFHLLIEDPSRAFKDAKYGKSYTKNFITTAEFTKILQQLYENNYILIHLSDVNPQLRLPKDKKPLILTQTQVNYYTYMTDSDNDKLPDAGGAGFASKLILDANGSFTCEMVDTNGQTITGSFDMVPILESFIETHPDFSYKGARAILAVTGYDGLFGYRTNTSAKDYFGAQQWEQEVSGATMIAEALRNAGYDLACYTYENVAYGNRSASQIRADLDCWKTEVSPILGVVDTLVFARDSDIANPNTAYTGEKFTMLNDFGFTNFLGFCADGSPWTSAQETILRQGRILVSGNSITNHTDWFVDIFDTQTVLDPLR